MPISLEILEKTTSLECSNNRINELIIGSQGEGKIILIEDSRLEVVILNIYQDSSIIMQSATNLLFSYQDKNYHIQHIKSGNEYLGNLDKLFQTIIPFIEANTEKGIFKPGTWSLDNYNGELKELKNSITPSLLQQLMTQKDGYVYGAISYNDAAAKFLQVMEITPYEDREYLGDFGTLPPKVMAIIGLQLDWKIDTLTE